MSRPGTPITTISPGFGSVIQYPEEAFLFVPPTGAETEFELVHAQKASAAQIINNFFTIASLFSISLNTILPFIGENVKNNRAKIYLKGERKR